VNASTKANGTLYTVVTPSRTTVDELADIA
jgi:hypothetical protein